MKWYITFILLAVVCSACAGSPSDQQITNGDASSGKTPTTEKLNDQTPVFVIKTPLPGFKATAEINADNIAPTETAEELNCLNLEGWEVEKIDASIECWKNVIAQDPQSFYGLFGLSRLYGIRGRTQESIDFGVLALNYAPDTEYKSRILLNIGISYMFLKNYANSINYLGEAIKIGNPESRTTIDAYFYLAEIYNQQNQKEKACENFKKYIEIGTKIHDESVMSMSEYETSYCP